MQFRLKKFLFLVFYFFCKITRRKLKRWNSLLYRSVNSPYCSWWREPFHVFHTVIETRLSANRGSRFQNVILLFILISPFQVFVNFAKQQTDDVEFTDNTNNRGSLHKLCVKMGLLKSSRLRTLRGDDSSVRFTSLNETNDMDDFEVTFSSNVSTDVALSCFK